MGRWSLDLQPKLITVIQEGYTRKLFAQDAMAGVVVGVVALPLAIAFAIASGVRPEQGLFTAIIGGFLISAFSGSRVQIGGPTGAFVVLVHSVIDQYGYDGLAIATLMAGALLVAMGLARLGTVIRFIPYPVTVGFTAGIALIIAMGQLRDAFGLDIESIPSNFVEKCTVYWEHADSINGWAFGMTLLTVILVKGWPRLGSRIPGPLVALITATVATLVFDLPVETIASRFGEIPNGLPRPAIPTYDLTRIGDLVSPAVSIALLGGIESLLSAVVADGMTGRRHRSNAELVGQGIANLVTPLFGGIPATGAIARTATNVKNGGKTPIAGIVHSITLLLILWFAGKWAALIPMATLAGILLVVAYNMSDWRVFARLFRGPASDTLVLSVTFLITVLVDLTVAIQAGVVLASLLFMKRMAEVTEIRDGKSLTSDADLEDPFGMDDLPDGVAIFEINGSFCFGAAQKFSEVMESAVGQPKVIILRMRHVLAMDATGLHALEEVARRFQRQETRLLLSGVQRQPMDALRRSRLLAEIGEENVLDNWAVAKERAITIIAAMQPD